MKGIEDIKDMIRFTFAADAFTFAHENQLNPYGNQELILLRTLTPDREFHPKLFLDHSEKIDTDFLNNIASIGAGAPLFLMKGLTTEKLLTAVKDYINLTPHTPQVIALGKFFFKLTYDLFLGVKFIDTFEESKEMFPEACIYIDKGLHLTTLSLEGLISSKYSATSSIEESGVLTIFLLKKYWDNFEEMFKMNEKLGGAVTDRALILAMMVGAKGGIPHFAKEWYENLKNRSELEEILHKFE